MRAIFLIVVAGLFLIFSCGSFKDDTDSDDSISIVNVTGKALLMPSYGEPDPAIQTAAVGANDFAFRLGVCRT